MQPDISMSPLRLLDANRLRSVGIFSGKTQEISNEVRDLMAENRQACFIASRMEAQCKAILALCIFSQIHPVHKNAYMEIRFACCPVEGSAFESSSNCIESIDSNTRKHPVVSEPDQIKKSVLDTALRYAFFTMQLHRVSLLLPIADHHVAEVAMQCGMIQEAVLDEALCIDEVYVDAGLFSLLASEYPDYGAAFVAYPHGVLSVRGGSDAVEGVRFYQYGQEITDPYERQVAIRIGIADVTGHLYESGSKVYANACNGCPEEIIKAARELREYFGKSRTNFSVKIRFAGGSEFQRHVWSELQKIPYGSTVSYEDVALALTGNDRVAARNLSRAVGSACAENPIPIIVPCHRVIGKDGRLVGFSGGVENKEFLLDHEMFGFFRDTARTANDR